MLYVAETKGSTDSLEFRKIEDAKIKCARKHFKEISNGEIGFDVVKDYEELLNNM
jgi:type III restriction enzyme